MAVSKKKLDTNDKYLQQLEDIKIRVPKGYRDIIKEFAIKQGYNNVNQLVLSLINEKMEQVGYEERVPIGVREAKAKTTEEGIREELPKRVPMEEKMIDVQKTVRYNKSTENCT